MRILLVDDDEVLMQALAERLIQQRYAVDIAVDGQNAQSYIGLFHYDLVVLDLLLPDVSGTDLCKTLRQASYENPILMLTARASISEKVRALDAGADDYIIKPFDFDELCARIRALLRREHQALPTILAYEALTLNPNTFETNYQGRSIRLTPKEFSLMELFLRHPNRVYSLDAIIEDLWSFEDPPSEDAVRTHIKGLRHKLKAAGAPKDLIKTVYGLGYRLKPAGASDFPATEDASTVVPSTTPETVPQLETLAALKKAWDKYQDTMHARVDVLETAATALQNGSLNHELHQNGCVNAHKLVGALGSFGFSEGSRLARELEQILQNSGSLDGQQVSQFSDLVQQLRQSITQTSEDEATEAVFSGAPLLLIVSAEPDWAMTLAAIAAAQGLRTRIATDLTLAQHLISTTAPQIILLDSQVLQGDYEKLQILSQQLRPDTTSLLVVDDRPDLNARLQIVQQGGCRILERTYPAQQLVSSAIQVLQSRSAGAKIALVDDDPQLLIVLKTSLQDWGFQVITLDGAERLWEMMETQTPDVLVLDIEMPGINGLELCQILRADPRWQALPIVFLTVHQDDRIREQAFRAGADDFISKSVATTELATRILNRLHH